MKFLKFPITPSSAPSSDYEVANKKYVDDNAGGIYYVTTAQEFIDALEDTAQVYKVVFGNIEWSVTSNTSINLYGDIDVMGYIKITFAQNTSINFTNTEYYTLTFKDKLRVSANGSCSFTVNDWNLCINIVKLYLFGNTLNVDTLDAFAYGGIENYADFLNGGFQDNGILPVFFDDEPEADSTNLITSGAVFDALAGGGDMLKATYDPNNKSADAFNADNHVSGTTNKVYTATEQTKLAGIDEGAEVNVNADWDASSGDAQILNKPTIPSTAADVGAVPTSRTVNSKALSSDITLTAADVSAVATSGNETVAGIKTFSSFPVTPSSAPTSDYQAANKKYVDDNAGGGVGVETGSYTGTGSYGSSNPCSITFTNASEIVYIYTPAALADYIEFLILVVGCTSGIVYSNGNDYAMTVTWSNGNKTVSWYGGSNAMQQMNLAGTYKYVSFY